MKFLVYDKLNVRETIVPWCEEKFRLDWQWFPYYRTCNGYPAIMFRIDINEDALAFKLRWSDCIIV